ncbi:methyl-accepting chemotaxis protein [Propionispora vibrioides]|uniref:Methyl-accepting chemotaxis protein n=1 Tax=Propionispora vibrioides TaxID=112903 RepID=A0A1H8TRB7_9FIRM|nr:methyl-accepting chemotaxis protein [Propionispora vibrioides]SEO93376.1 methyl-accepting chemotaxis protein [Propionispora vibrioides]
MKGFGNSLGSKFYSIVALLIAFLAVVGIAGYYFNQQAARNLRTTYEEDLLPNEYLNRSATNIRALQGELLELMITDNKEREKELVQDMAARTAENGNLLGRYEKLPLSAYEREQYAIFQDELAAWRTHRPKVIELATGGQKQAAYAYYVQNLAVHAGNLNKLLDDLTTFNSRQAEENKQNNDKAASLTGMLLLSLTVLAMLIGGFFSRRLVRSLSKRIGQAVQTIEEIAQGHIRRQEAVHFSRDEIGQMDQGLQTMGNNLRVLLEKVSTLAGQVDSSAGQLTDTAEQSAQAAGQVAASITGAAQGADQQAAMADDVMNRLEELAQGVTQVAANTGRITQVSEESAQAAREGLQSVDAAVRQMESIEHTVSESVTTVGQLESRSQEIGQIVELIASIAAQTNLLALNAAIEAARAGEQGRGFAVVAEEVRHLAEQSQEAAQQISDLIRNVQQDTGQAVSSMGRGAAEVKKGAGLVQQAGQAFADIVSRIGHSVTLMKEEAAVTEQMAANSGQILEVVRDMAGINHDMSAQAQTISAVTEEQSAAAEEIAAASQSLATLANELKTATSRFTLHD